MNIIGVTGGVGSGKTTILNYLEEHYNANIICADSIGKSLSIPGNPIFDRIVEAFSKSILNKDGSINRKLLGFIVFNDKAKLKKLNSIIHPAVMNNISEQINLLKSTDSNSLIIIESAILIEAGYKDICDTVWYIYCDNEIRYKRLAQSRGYTKEQYDNIVANQSRDEIYKLNCDYIIDNSLDTQNTIQQIKNIMANYN